MTPSARSAPNWTLPPKYGKAHRAVNQKQSDNDGQQSERREIELEGTRKGARILAALGDRLDAQAVGQALGDGLRPADEQTGKRAFQPDDRWTVSRRGLAYQVDPVEPALAAEELLCGRDISKQQTVAERIVDRIEHREYANLARGSGDL